MTDKLTKKEFIDAISSKTGVTKVYAEKVFKTIFETIRESVKDGKALSINGFGTFKPVTRSARNGVNPSTGESIKIPEKKTVKFKPSSSLVDDLNQ